MYINFQQLAASGITLTQLALLLAIRQKDDIAAAAIGEADTESLLEKGLIEQLKNKSYRLTNKGTSYVSAIETPGITEEISKTLDTISKLYESNGKDIGVSLKEAESRLIWFMGNTNFKPKVIVSVTEEYIASSGEYTMSLCNFIWKPPSQAFSTHMNLKNSKLFDLIAKKFGFNREIYFDTRKNKEMDWLFGVAKLPQPPARADRDCLFTSSVEEEKNRIKNIKIYLSNRIKKEVL